MMPIAIEPNIPMPLPTISSSVCSNSDHEGKAKRLRLFSRDATPIGKEKAQQPDELEHHEPTMNMSSDGSSRTNPHYDCSILKYKTQEESIARPYPKPFICSKSQCPKPKKAVQFAATMIVRTYPAVLSDHPCTLEGPAVGLGWTVLEESTLRLPPEDSDNDDHNTDPYDFLLCKWSRERMLLNNGYTKQQFKKAERKAKKIRKSRKRNAQLCPAWVYALLGNHHKKLYKYVEDDRGKSVKPDALKTKKRIQ